MSYISDVEEVDRPCIIQGHGFWGIRGLLVELGYEFLSVLDIGRWFPGVVRVVIACPLNKVLDFVPVYAGV
jgi:hypothetical protein